VITLDEQISDDPALTLPHPRAAERAFVLVPWLVLEPGATLPGLGSVASLLAAIPIAEVEQIVLMPEAVLHR
jgi:2-amino-4-hydroxy-6-hydroxymethyldihydropteridine diphosphokinase